MAYFCSKQQLGIKHLNRPIDEISTFPRLNKNEPGAVQWSPHHETLFGLCVRRMKIIFLRV